MPEHMRKQRSEDNIVGILFFCYVYPENQTRVVRFGSWTVSPT